MDLWNGHAFGLRLASRFPLPGMEPGASDALPDVILKLSSPARVADAWSGTSRPPLWQPVFSEGRAFRLEAGDAGDHQLTYEGRALFHLSGDLRTLRCAPVDQAELSWQRQLLDTVLFCISVLHGFHLLHASAVEMGGAPVAFAGVTGSGKSSLAAALVERGATLFADDIVAMKACDGAIVAHPGPPVMCLPLECAAARNKIGTVIGMLPGDGEAWVEIDCAAEVPAPPKAIYLLERRSGQMAGVQRLPASSLHLLPHSVTLGRAPDRYAETFEFFGDLALRTPVYRLQADLTVPAHELADLVEASLSAPAIPPVRR